MLHALNHLFNLKVFAKVNRKEGDGAGVKGNQEVSLRLFGDDFGSSVFERILITVLVFRL